MVEGIRDASLSDPLSVEDGLFRDGEFLKFDASG